MVDLIEKIKQFSNYYKNLILMAFLMKYIILCGFNQQNDFYYYNLTQLQNVQIIRALRWQGSLSLLRWHQL
jgi:hypothetical protein